MSGQHTQGKIKAVGPELRMTTGRYRMATNITACGAGGNMRQDVDAALANARRLAACWNACEGMPTEHIEALSGCGTLGDLRKSELAAARALLREVMKEVNSDSWHCVSNTLHDQIKSYLDASDTLGEKS